MRQFFEYHPVIGYRFTPNLKARIPSEGGGYLIQVNETGFRSNRPFVKERAPGCRRVLVFGDSFTAGDTVPNHLRYSDLLETRVPHLEVYNFGLPSTGTDQHYLVWREFAQGIEHDLVVIAVYVENVRRIVAEYYPFRDEYEHERYYAKPYFTLDQGKLNLHHVPPPREPLEAHELPPGLSDSAFRFGRYPLLREFATTLGIKQMMQRLIHYQPLPAYDAPDTPGWCLMRAILGQWIRTIPKPVLIVPIPLAHHMDGLSDAGPYQARFKELAAELGCALHDPLPDILQHRPEDRRRFRWERDVHFTPEGNEVMADSLAPVIAQLLGDPH